MVKNLPVKLLYGKEDFLKQEWLEKQLRLIFKDPSSKELNYHSFWCQKKSRNFSDFRTVLDLVKTSPFLSDKRLVVIREVEYLSSKEEEVLHSYIETPYTFSLLVLETKEGALRRNPFLQKLSKNAETIPFHPLKGGELLRWVQQRAALNNQKVDEEAFSVIRERAGDRLVDLAGVLDELSLYVGQRREITCADALTLLGRSAPHDAFGLAEAILRRDQKRALMWAHQLSMEGVSPAEMIGALYWQLNHLRQPGVTPSPAAPSRHLDERTFTAFVNRLVESDEAIKTGVLGGEIALEKLILELCA